MSTSLLSRPPARLWRNRLVSVSWGGLRIICVGMSILGTGAGFYWQRGYVADILSASSPEGHSPRWWEQRSEPAPPASLKAIGDPERIKRMLPVGRTELLHTKGGFTGTLLQPDDHWRDRRRQFACVFESLVRRTIESNDGVSVVELRQFESVRTARLFGEAEQWRFALGPPDQEILRGFPRTGQVGLKRVSADRLADAILVGGAEVLGEASNVAYLQVDSLSGKAARIAYVDGKGVVSVEAVGCVLSAAERQFLARTVMLADAYLATAMGTESQPPPVDATHLAFLLDPCLRQIPPGEALVQLDLPGTNQGRAETRFRVMTNGDVEKPNQEGALIYRPNEGRIQSAFLKGPAVSFLRHSGPAQVAFPSVLATPYQPVLQLSYSCVAEEPVPLADQALAHASADVLCLPGASRFQRPSGDFAVAAWNSPGGDNPLPVDLTAARMLLLTIVAGCFWCGCRIARGDRVCLTASTAAVAVGLLVGFSVYLHGRLWLAELLPLSSAIVLGNWIPPGAAFVAGVLSQQRSIPCWRRAILILVLTALGGSTLANSSLSTKAIAEHQWSADGVCIQTASATCSACAAATLLADRGIFASEPEMARLCLSTETGTPLLGLYRGLKLKTSGTRWDVEIIRCGADELKRLDNLPALLSVRLGATSVIGTGDLGKDTGRMSGTCHAVVLFGFLPDGRAEIGDPSQYRHDRGYWSAEQLKSDYMGECIRLVERRL